MKARNWENIRKDDCLPTVRGQNLQGNLTTVLHPGLSPDPLLLLAFLSIPFFFLLKHVTTCPASNHTAVELGLVLFRVSFKLLAYPGVWDFLPCGTFLSVVLFQQMAVRGAEWVQPSPTLQTLWQPPCPCSECLLLLSGTQCNPSRCFNGTHGQGSNRKRTTNSAGEKHTPFSSSSSHLCVLYWSFGCLLTCSLPLGNRAGTGLWDPDCVATSKGSTPLCFVRSLYICLGCRTSTGCLLSLAGTSFLPVPSISSMPVNASQHQQHWCLSFSAPIVKTDSLTCWAVASPYQLATDDATNHLLHQCHAKLQISMKYFPLPLSGNIFA